MPEKSQAPKQHRYLLIDFENVQAVDFAKLDGSIHVVVFTGAAQTKIPLELVAKTQKMGSRLEWKHIDKAGNNALDFFIAYQLGKIFEKEPLAECFVLSKDKGFDPLLKHLQAKNRKASRIEKIAEIK